MVVVTFPRGSDPHRPSDYEARVQTDPAVWGAGKSREGALASLYANHPELRGADVHHLSAESDEAQHFSARVQAHLMLAPLRRW